MKMKHEINTDAAAGAVASAAASCETTLKTVVKSGAATEVAAPAAAASINFIFVLDLSCSFFIWICVLDHVLPVLLS